MWRRVPCEQQLNMGQPALRDAAKAVAKVLDELFYSLKVLRCFPKGNWVNIPKPDYGNSSTCTTNAVTQTISGTSVRVRGRVVFSL